MHPSQFRLNSLWNGLFDTFLDAVSVPTASYGSRAHVHGRCTSSRVLLMRSNMLRSVGSHTVLRGHVCDLSTGVYTRTDRAQTPSGCFDVLWQLGCCAAVSYTAV